MIHSLSRFSKNLLEGFSGVYVRPDGNSVSFSLCLNPENATGKNAKELKRQTLIEAKNRAGVDASPQVYAMSSNLKLADLSAGIKYALQSGDVSVPVFIEVPNKAFFANACEALGMSRRSLIDLAGSSFVAAPEVSTQAHGGFHRLLGNIYDQPHLPISVFDNLYGHSLQRADPKSYDYATSVSADLKNALPGVQKYVLQFKEKPEPKHIGGNLGRYFAPDKITAIEAKVKMGAEADAKDVNYTFVLFPAQFTDGPNDFDVSVLIERDKKYSLHPVMFSVCPNKDLNNVEFGFKPFVDVGTIHRLNEMYNQSFDYECHLITQTLLSSLEWINSPNAQRVDHQPKQKQMQGQDLAAQFAAGGKRPFFASIEVKIPDEGSSITPIHSEQTGSSTVRGERGLQSVTSHWQRYNSEWKFKGPFVRGNPNYGVSARMGVGGTEPK